jgi:hypothetical protein
MKRRLPHVSKYPIERSVIKSLASGSSTDPILLGGWQAFYPRPGTAKLEDKKVVAGGWVVNTLRGSEDEGYPPSPAVQNRTEAELDTYGYEAQLSAPMQSLQRFLGRFSIGGADNLATITYITDGIEVAEA